jgi:SM-20-related protein
MLSPYFAHNLEQQLSTITEHGFCVMDNFATQATVSALVKEISVLNDATYMHAAGTGQTQITINNQLRGDSIYWLNEANSSVAQQTYLDQMELLRLALNQHLYLGLFTLESHLALYKIGTGYGKHLDRFQQSNIKSSDQRVRQISCILYLNQDWLEVDGGYLRLYLNPSNTMTDTPHIDIAPLGGRLVLFLSDTFYHEVLLSSKARMSLTGWFLTRQ